MSITTNMSSIIKVLSSAIEKASHMQEVNKLIEEGKTEEEIAAIKIV